MNILILSVGTRNKIVQYFKQTIDGIVVATDMSRLAPAIYEADKFYIVPRITEYEYLNIILNICKDENINAVLSLIDPELSLLAKNIDNFKKIGVTVIGSSYELCEICFNKWSMFNWLKSHEYKCAKSYIDINEFYRDLEKKVINFPVFVKPICGSASVSISKIYNPIMLENLLSHNDNLMIQEYLNGPEIGADVYIDMLSGDVVSIFTKEKILMRAGETYKAVSFKDPFLFNLIEDFVKKMGLLGQIDIDLFKVNNEYYISEVNPRFGGGYPHAFESGCNHMKMIENNIIGKINKKNIGLYDEHIYMMKYNEIYIKCAQC